MGCGADAPAATTRIGIRVVALFMNPERMSIVHAPSRGSVIVAE